MPKADTVTFGARVYVDNIEVTPIKPWLQWISETTTASTSVFVSMHKVAASAANEVISISEDTNTVLTILWDNSATGSTLTVKTNSDSDSRSVKPVRILSGALSAITVSNSDTVNAQYLGIARIVVSDTTNTTLKEIDDAF